MLIGLRLVHNMTVDFRFVSLRMLPSLSSICEHTPYNETLRNERNGGIDLDSIPPSPSRTYQRKCHVISVELAWLHSR